MTPAPHIPDPAAAGDPIRRRPHGQRRRQQIVEVAVRLFSAHGFNAVSLREIADQVGVSQAGLLHHFPTKDALLMAVLQDREERNKAQTQARLAEGHDGISAFLQTLADNQQNPVLVQLFALISSEALSVHHPAHEWWTDRYRAMVITMEHAVSDAFSPGDLPPDVTSETVARWLIALADGLRVQWLLDRDAVDRAESVGRFVGLLGRRQQDQA